MRAPRWSNWLPWQGQANPIVEAWAGQPTWVQRFEKTTNIARGASQSWSLPPV